MLTPVQVPHTQAKLAQSLTIIAYQQVDTTGLPVKLPGSFNPAEIANSIIASGAGVASITPLGAVFGFNVKQDRVNTRRRGINSSIEPWSIVPGPITTTIEIERTVLYAEDAMKAFNFHSNNIAFQIKPLCFVELTNVPDDNGKPLFGMGPNINSNKIGSLTIKQVMSAANRSPIYMNCWISNRAINYRLEGDQMVVENLTLDVGNVFSPVEAALSAGASLVNGITAGALAGGATGGITGAINGAISGVTTSAKNLAKNIPILKNLF